MGYIDVSNLHFSYEDKPILKDLTFTLDQGSVTALVGPNGAGKTTLMRCLIGLETPARGQVHVAGLDVSRDPRAVHQKIGYLSDFFGLYDGLKVRDCLRFMGRSQGLVGAALEARIDELVEQVDLLPYIDKKAGSLSRGYRQRLGVGLALIHSPDILLLDEPASGMDPEVRLHFSALIKSLNQDHGMTLIVSSHILAELEDYCSGMLVIRDGEIRSHVVLGSEEAGAYASLKDAYLALSDREGGADDQVQAKAKAGKSKVSKKPKAVKNSKEAS